MSRRRLKMATAVPHAASASVPCWSPCRSFARMQSTRPQQDGERRSGMRRRGPNSRWAACACHNDAPCCRLLYVCCNEAATASHPERGVSLLRRAQVRAMVSSSRLGSLRRRGVGILQSTVVLLPIMGCVMGRSNRDIRLASRGEGRRSRRRGDLRDTLPLLRRCLIRGRGPRVLPTEQPRQARHVDLPLGRHALLLLPNIACVQRAK